MQIKKKKITAKEELDLLTGLIVSDKFIADICPILDLNLLKVPHIKKVAKWCVEHYKKYNKAPGKTISDIFSANKKRMESEEIDLIEDFLDNLSEDYENDFDNFNEKFILDHSEKYLKEQSFLMLAENIKGNIAQGKIEQAEKLLLQHKKIEITSNKTIDVLNDKDAIKKAINEERNVIYTFPGTLGEMVMPLERQDFFSFIAPMKRGKSFYLMDLVVSCIMAGMKCLYFSFEMPQNQVMRRIYQNLLGETRYPIKIQVPYFITEKRNGEEVRTGEIGYKTKNKKGLSVKKAVHKAKQLEIMIQKGSFRLLCRPAYTMNVQDAKEEILSLAHYHDFYPDAVFFDYPDIMRPESHSGKDKLHRIDDTWLAVRALAQEINGLVGAVTQSTRGTFSKDISEEDVSENIRKIAHVTHMMSLNQDRKEKKMNVMRAGMLANRDQEFHVDDEVVMLYQLALSKPYLASEWKKNVNL
jgi:hypothetical protein